MYIVKKACMEFKKFLHQNIFFIFQNICEVAPSVYRISIHFISCSYKRHIHRISAWKKKEAKDNLNRVKPKCAYLKVQTSPGFQLPSSSYGFKCTCSAGQLAKTTVHAAQYRIIQKHADAPRLLVRGQWSSVQKIRKSPAAMFKTMRIHLPVLYHSRIV